MITFAKEMSPDWVLTFAEGEEKALDVRPGEEARTLRVSLGREPDLELVRRAAAKALRTVAQLGGGSALLQGGEVYERLGAEGLAALVQGARLAQYKAPTWGADKGPEAVACALEAPETGETQAAVAEANILADAVCFARDLVNTPASHLTPAELARRVAEAAVEAGVETQIVEEDEARALGMDAFLAVGTSSANRPRLIILRWRGGEPGQAPIALVGKGVTFDSGGYSLKPASSMREMFTDMAGGAAVAGAIVALARQKAPVNVIALIPAVENRISPDSFLPGDVIGSMSGKTIEIGTTDAEGRLILADAITYAIEKEGAAKVVDIATLTGAIVRMLGYSTAGAMANDDALYGELQRAAGQAGERYWRMPDYPEYRELIKSSAADLYNSSWDGCGAITAGLFLGAFAGETPWVHLDIAGTARVNKPIWPYQSKGATGAGVTTLYHLCKNC